MTPSEPATQARRLARAAGQATLATRLAGPQPADVAGWPYASLVLLALETDATPLLLMSDLSEHSRNIAADPRMALLVDGTAGYRDPLAGPRVTLLGRAEPTADARARARFLARHPEASLYAGFADFKLYRVTLLRAHLVAGFGRIHWIDPAEILLTAPALADEEAAILDHMNGDHAEAIERMASCFCGVRGKGWRMTGIDPDGCDLRRKGETARLAFPAPVRDAGEAREMLVTLSQEAGAGAPAETASRPLATGRAAARPARSRRS
jgi:putative heme iron utilization protein